jgi:predicted SAM-dependent methyltransferase
MKINLLINGKHILAGYINIDPLAVDGDGKIAADISNLDATIDDGEADEIIADSILDYFPYRNTASIVGNWVKKLRKGGKLILVCPNIYEVARQLMRREITETQANELIYDGRGEDWQLKKNLYSVTTMEEMLKSMGMKTISKKLVNHKHMLTAEKV